ncbi:MAG: [FeFe] hydrogenase H-cluster maturation GTPase HydF [Peptococcaceae bacterium]|nr:[FeFe] hydrogenase H-cluster maturation GTPase HydF [Peptococcaceae bacterium]
MSLQETPTANRLHIGFFGRCNSGKSTLINAFTAQQVTIVSPVAGTTTDVVQKNIELHGLGPCTLLDTAGFDDASTDLGTLRMEKTAQSAERVDIAVVVFDSEDLSEERQWIQKFKARRTPVVGVVSKCDLRTPDAAWVAECAALVDGDVLLVNIQDKSSLDALLARLVSVNPLKNEPEITHGLVDDGDLVLLVMPQDIQAPKGRLILPQVQTLRELLDKHCMTISVTPDKLEAALALLKEPPKLIITDSQVFPMVHDLTPAGTLLTSFSVLMAGLKGDIASYVAGAKAIESLPPDARILIAELCSHAPLEEDIGRVKIPRLLKKRLGDGISVDVVSGHDFPADVSGYDLIIQCGACMVNRKLVQNRIIQASEQHTPISNYGIVIAYLNRILDDIAY